MDEHPTTVEKLNHGSPTTPRQSASVIVLRDASAGADGAGIELLLVRRNPAQRFMGGFWVFPGGAVDAADGAGAGGDGAHRAAGVRELEEEAAIAGVGSTELVAYSRWITPALIETRFDTHFFLVRAPAEADPRPDGVECVDLRWSSPQAALQANTEGELALAFPTLRHLQELSQFASVDALLTHARGLNVQPIEPFVVLRDGSARVFLPGDDGYPGQRGVP